MMLEMSSSQPIANGPKYGKGGKGESQTLQSTRQKDRLVSLVHRSLHTPNIVQDRVKVHGI